MIDHTAILKAEFHSLMAQHKVLAESRQAWRDQYDALAVEIATLKAQQDALAAQFLPVEAEMSELSNAAAAYARALNGQTGEPPAVVE